MYLFVVYSFNLCIYLYVVLIDTTILEPFVDIVRLYSRHEALLKPTVEYLPRYVIQPIHTYIYIPS